MFKVLTCAPSRLSKPFSQCEESRRAWQDDRRAGNWPHELEHVRLWKSPSGLSESARPSNAWGAVACSLNGKPDPRCSGAPEMPDRAGDNRGDC